jgi:hypothetical protein
MYIYISNQISPIQSHEIQHKMVPEITHSQAKAGLERAHAKRAKVLKRTEAPGPSGRFW